MNRNIGTLFVVATPIGNLDDMVPRAVDVLQSVDIIAAEDTRRTGQLCSHFGIRTTMVACHDHNEESQVKKLMDKLRDGKNIALVSDAGMPLISDPGYRIVRAARQEQYDVSVVPGACAAITALAGSGLPSDRFQFLGFPAAKKSARQKWLSEYSQNTETLIFYESSHRILETLKDIEQVFDPDRQIVVARELTKTYETWLNGEVSTVRAMVEVDPNQQKGEFVIVVQGVSEKQSASDVEIAKTMRVLLKELPIKKAAAMAAELLGVKKNECYDIGLITKEQG